MTTIKEISFIKITGRFDEEQDDSPVSAKKRRAG
jgi:hypothetical protein